MTTAENTATGVLLTEAAAAKAKALLDQEGRDAVSYTHLTLPTILLV